MSWKDFVPSLGRRWIGRLGIDRLQLNALSSIACDTTNLSTRIDDCILRGLLESPCLAEQWARIEPRLSALRIAEGADGVNPGDRRAIFHILSSLASRSVLEIGTHVGASTTSVVAALANDCAASTADAPRMTTVDVVDVNDEVAGPWKTRHSTYSPRAMVSMMGAAEWVTFVTAASLDYLGRCTERFDFIFLDGNHSARTVYREVPAALRLLNPNGILLLHDYFPGGRPLWSDGVVIRGPWLAIERLCSEGAPIRIVPFGELPWPTKERSRVSSLALLVGSPR